MEKSRGGEEMCFAPGAGVVPGGLIAPQMFMKGHWRIIKEWEEATKEQDEGRMAESVLKEVKWVEEADKKVKLNFPPFQHYKFNDDDQLICVGKSHWTGGLVNGHFSLQDGKTTDKLAMMWMKLCDRYATRGNVRGYTYNDEMKGQAILQLAQIGLQFDESKSQNPFAYYTAAVTNSFVRVINLEKRNQNIRDDILEMNHMNPSYTRQAQGEWEKAMRHEKERQAKNSANNA